MKKIFKVLISLIILLIVIFFVVIQMGLRTWWDPRTWNWNIFDMLTSRYGIIAQQEVHKCFVDSPWNTQASIEDRDACIAGVALKMRDYTICDNVSDTDSGSYQDSRGSCIRSVAVAKNDVQICRLIKENTNENLQYKTLCFYDVAKSLQEPALCAEINDAVFIKDNPSFREQCLMESATQASTCQQINNSNYEQSCYARIGILLKDPSYCKEMVGQQSTDYCLQRVAEAKTDVSVCGNISSQSIKDFCFFRIAYTTKDSTICNKILDKTYKDTCLKNVTEK